MRFRAWLGELGRRLWHFVNRGRLARELRDEMEAHRAMKGDAGPPFGNTLRLREESEDVWGWTWFDRLSQDLRFGARLFRRAPWFGATAILVLSLGVGVNLAAFQVLDAVTFTPLPVTAPDRLVTLMRHHARGFSTTFSYPSFDFYRTHTAPIAAAFALTSASVTFGEDLTRRVEVQFVSGNYFADLGARPAAGRLLEAADDRPGATPVLVIGERWWKGRFGADPAVVGRAINVNGHPFLVAGIAPETFVGLDDGPAIAWAPIAQHGVAFPGSRLLQDTGSGPVRVHARLQPGVSIEQAQAELRATARALHGTNPAAAPDDEWVRLTPAGRYLPLEDLEGPGLALASALVLLLLITACMNLGLLVLSRTLSRDREFSIRLAVGASRGRVLRQLVTEQLLLAAAGAVAGLFVASVATKLFVTATGLPPGIVPRLTPRSVAVAVGLAALSGVLFGIAPALQAIRPSVGRRMRARTILVGVQVATAMVLLIVSGLIVRGITRIVRVSLGFDYREVALFDPELTSHGLEPEAARAYWSAVEQRVRGLPTVGGTALTTLPPFGNRVTINGDRAVLHGVSPDYFSTMGVALRRGRIFAAEEAGVVVVSETLARRQWGDEDPLGKSYDGNIVIGVAGDARSARIGDGSTTECYYPIKARELPGAVMVVRATGPPRDLAAPLMAIARTEAPEILPAVILLPEALHARVQDSRRFAYVASSLGVCALLLAVIGLGGIVAFTVTQRLREIGVRIALGAGQRHVLAAVARQFAWPIGIGVIAGSLLAAGVGTLLSRELFGVSQFDPLAHGGAALLFVSVAGMAALPSARRALRVDPARALRHE